jgi:hypothetical protein
MEVRMRSIVNAAATATSEDQAIAATSAVSGEGLPGSFMAASVASATARGHRTPAPGET